MDKMNLTKLFQVVIATFGLLGLGSAHSATVTCGNATLGVRTVTVDPALVGGYCYAKDGNFAGDDFSAFDGGLTMLGKEVAANGDVASAALSFTQNGAGTGGTWGISSSLWGDYQQILLAFHFGQGQANSAADPDSFIVELQRANSGGTWELGGTGARLNGLSNIYVLGHQSCTSAGVNCAESNTANVPEPASLALVGLGLLGAAISRRRQR